MFAHPNHRVSFWVRAAGWLRGSRAGLFVIAVVVGAGSGLGAVAFRYLIYFFTWLAIPGSARAATPAAATCRGWARGFFV